MQFCGIQLADLDFNLVEATLASIQTQSLTPIIKEELKLKIQSKRLALGQEELPKPIFKEPEKWKLTPEEEQKRDHRRESNRVAAAKCRNKRKSSTENMKTSLAEEQLKNYSLKRKIEDMESEKLELIQRLQLQHTITPTGSIDIQPASICPTTAVSSPSPHTATSPGPLSSSSSPIVASPALPNPTSSLNMPNTYPVLQVPVALTLPSVGNFNFITSPDSLNMPSTSSGLYSHQAVARRRSEEYSPRMSTPSYRRFSADCNPETYFGGYYQGPQRQLHPFSTAQTPMIPTEKLSVANAPAVQTCTDNQAHSPNYEKYTDNQQYSANSSFANKPDLETDYLSDDEFFQFENQQIPFEQYQTNIVVPTENSMDMVVSDGLKYVEKNRECMNNNLGTEEYGPENKQLFDSYFIPLIPVFEDDATVPEYGQENQTCPTSPTFY